jgi:phosphate-selective porin OprO and OprP
MKDSLHRGCTVAALALGAGAVAFADDKTSSSAATDDKVARLESLLDVQQQKIADLEQQVAAASGQDVDKARVEEMKRQIREVLSEREFRESLMPSVVQAGYDHGFYIGSSDDHFKMKFNGDMQFRWTHYATRSRNRYEFPRLERDDRTGFDIQRLRLAISGHAYSKDLTYNLELRADSEDNYDVVLHRAWVNYRFSDQFQIRAGAFQTSAMRSQQLRDERDLQFVDWNIVDNVFGFGNGLGVQFWGHLFDGQMSYFIDVVNSLNTIRNRTITPDPAERDNNPALLARTVWHILGDPLVAGSSCGRCGEGTIEGDLRKDKSQPFWDLGFSYAFNEDDGDASTRIPFPMPRNPRGIGGFGLTTTAGSQIHQFAFDTTFKYQGFSLVGEYVVRTVDPRAAGGTAPWSNWWLVSGDRSTTAQHGAYVQVGYFLPIPGLENKLEAVARVGGISALAEQREGTWEYAAGLNYYIEGHHVKLQADVTKISEVPISTPLYANVNDDALIFRVQLQVSF